MKVDDKGTYSQFVRIDEATISNLRELDDPSEPTSFVDELILIYRQEAPIAFKGLGEALARLDSGALVHWSHKLKGLSRNLGVRRLAEVCSTVEHTAEALNVSDLQRLIDLVEAELDAAFLLLCEHMTDKAA